MSDASWVAVDWGTSRLRVWVMSRDNRIVQYLANDSGMNRLGDKSDYERVLLAMLAAQLVDAQTLPVVICGMAGSREGWFEADYLPAPIHLAQQLQPCHVATSDSRIGVYIVPGIKQLQPANVMRGEETQIAGFLAEQAEYSGLLVLPGTHTKWVAVRDGKIERFSTAITGELFALLSTQSILRHSMAEQAWSTSHFETAFTRALNAPLGMSERFFEIRARHLLCGADSFEANSTLSAELIAQELLAMQASFGMDAASAVTLIGNDRLTAVYQQALALMAVKAEIYCGEEAVLKGLHTIYHQYIHASEAVVRAR